MWRLSLFTAALLAVALPDTGLAQPHPADRIRILTQNGITLTGKVMAVSGDSMAVAAPGAPAWLRRADIAYLERSAGRHRRFGRNFAATIAGTALVGGALAAITWEKCVSNSFLGCMMTPGSRSEAFVMGGAVGATIGVPLGILVGLAVRHDRWEPLHGTGRLSLTVSPYSARGPGLSASLSF